MKKRAIFFLPLVVFFGALLIFFKGVYFDVINVEQAVLGSSTKFQTPILSNEMEKGTPTEDVQKVSKKPIRYLFVGDMMLDRHIREKTRQQAYEPVLENVKTLFNEYDQVVGNLEGPITQDNSKSIGSRMGESRNYIFTFEPTVLTILKNANIRVFNIGNNHIMNFGQNGLSDTKRFIDDAGLYYFGDLVGSDRQVFSQDINGVRIAVVSYNQFGGNGIENALEIIRKERKESDIVFVYTHWGIEYKFQQPQSIRKLAHDFIDAGADVVIGSHPHVISEVEEYHEKKIYYSLGNFIFDQYFSKEVKKGLGVEVEMDPETKNLIFREHFFEMRPNGATVNIDPQ